MTLVCRTPQAGPLRLASSFGGPGSGGSTHLTAFAFRAGTAANCRCRLPLLERHHGRRSGSGHRWRGRSGQTHHAAACGAGLCVVIADTDHAAATQLVTGLQHRGHGAVFVDTDAADAEAVERLMAQAADLGTLRVLVNNAGGWLPGPQYPEGREWRRSVDLNLVMPMLAAQLAVPMMINSGGSIVNVSSSGGMGSRAYSSPEYGAAKAGLIRFTSCVADWADGHRIRVNCVVPHWIGLDRARHEFEQLTTERQRRSG